MSYSCKEDQLCFHCGLKGHPILHCPIINEDQTEAGKDAQQRFYDARKVYSFQTAQFAVISIL